MTKQEGVHLIEQYKLLSHEEKYEKLMIYLHAVQKSDPNYIGLYFLVEDLGPNNIDDASMIGLYDAFVSLIEYNDQSKFVQAKQIISKLQSLKNKEQEEKIQEDIESAQLLQSL